MGVEYIDTEEVVPITRLPPYVPPRKSIGKVTKDPESLKYKVFTPLARVPFFKMEEWDMGDHSKFPHSNLVNT